MNAQAGRLGAVTAKRNPLRLAGIAVMDEHIPGPVGIPRYEVPGVGVEGDVAPVWGHRQGSVRAPGAAVAAAAIRLFAAAVEVHPLSDPGARYLRCDGGH